MKKPDLSFDLTLQNHPDDFLKAWYERVDPDNDLSDQLFFDILKEDIECLSSPPFRHRIKKWQDILRSSSTPPSQKEQAKLRLMWIGQCLAEEKKGKSSIQDKDRLAITVLLLECEISQLFESLKSLRSTGNRIITYKQKITNALSYKIKSKFPGQEKYLISNEALSCCGKHIKSCSIREFSKCIVAKYYQVSVRSVEKALEDASFNADHIIQAHQGTNPYIHLSPFSLP